MVLRKTAASLIGSLLFSLSLLSQVPQACPVRIAHDVRGGSISAVSRTIENTRCTASKVAWLDTESSQDPGWVICEP